MSPSEHVPAVHKGVLGDGRLNNVLMLLPTCLIHCILSDWVEVTSVLRLDIALSSNKRFHCYLLGLLKSSPFYVKEVKPTEGKWWREGTPPPQHLYSNLLNWLLLRQVKVIDLELNKQYCFGVLEDYLIKFGEYVRHIHYNEEEFEHRSRKCDYPPTQNLLIAKHCHNLTGYFVDTADIHDESHLHVLNINKLNLETLHILGGCWRYNSTSTTPALALPCLKELKWHLDFPSDESLVTMVEAAPNLQLLSLSSNPYCHNHFEEEVILAVGRACPNLRTFSCKELHIGPYESVFKVFFASCRNIVNLDLSMHYQLRDNDLIEALSELTDLHSLDLRGCCRLTDLTLQFLVQRFFPTLQLLHLDHSVDPDYHEWYVDKKDNLVAIEQERLGGYTIAGIASLRAQCPQLHSFHYLVGVDMRVQYQPSIQDYQIATIVQMYNTSESLLPMVIEHCHQMQILVFSCDRSTGWRAWLTVDQLMLLAAHSPQLRVIVSECGRDGNEVDYSSVVKAFPKILFTSNMEVLEKLLCVV